MTRNQEDPPLTGMADDPSSIAEQTFGAMLRVFRIMQASLQQLEHACGLSGAQLLALWQLTLRNPSSISALADALHLHRSSTSNLVDKLENRGLVTRSRDRHDNRIVLVSLTTAGAELVQRIPGPTGGHLRHALQRLPAAHLEHLHASMGTLLDALARPSVP
ncbi:MAG: MarR family transcriptional regulator [Betaproteobacteria bacterium]|nr:MarR family transcriptional regulator [Betaproteobacteria bacterium]